MYESSEGTDESEDGEYAHSPEHSWLDKAISNKISCADSFTVLPAKSDSDVMFCLQTYKGIRIDRSLKY